MAWYRHPGVLVGAALVVALLMALAGSLVTGSGESGLRVDNDPDRVSEDDTLAGQPADGWAGTTLPRIVWPFKRSELVVFVADDVDADERAALAEELAAHDAAGQVRELRAGEVADRVGETQAPRLRSQGAGGAILIEMRGGAQARQAAKRILPTHDSERLERTSGSSEPPEHLYGDSRIAGTILPKCRQLARSAALTGAHHAQALLPPATSSPRMAPSTCRVLIHRGGRGRHWPSGRHPGHSTTSARPWSCSTAATRRGPRQRAAGRCRL